jgi:hypothetical protein
VKQHTCSMTFGGCINLKLQCCEEVINVIILNLSRLDAVKFLEYNLSKSNSPSFRQKGVPSALKGKYLKL